MTDFSTAERTYANSSNDFENPWSVSSTYVDIGSLEKVLYLAQKNGQIAKRQDDDYRNEAKKKATETSLSIQLTEQLKKLSSLKTSLYKVKEKINRYHLEQETSDLTNPDILDKKAIKLEDLSQHFSAIVDKKDECINRLQQPFVGDHIIIDIKHQRYLVEGIRKLSEILSNVTTYIETLSWGCNFNSKVRTMDDILAKISIISSTLAQMQSFFQVSFQQRNIMSKRLVEARKMYEK